MNKYTYEQMKHDKKTYGCLDGDFAKRCVKCKGRFTGSSSNLCPHCLNKSIDNFSKYDRIGS